MPAYKVRYIFEFTVYAENKEAALVKAAEDADDDLFYRYGPDSVKIEEIE